MRVSWLADERHSKESCDVSVKEYALIRATFYLPYKFYLIINMKERVFFFFFFFFLERKKKKNKGVTPQKGRSYPLPVKTLFRFAVPRSASPTNYLDANNHTCDSPLRVFKNALNEVTKKGKGINNKSRSCYTDLWHIPVQINVIQLTRPHERA
ncbi:hypothetical protein POVWA1_005000 [Plasmodium ovale wallikeri]|uniref:Uncharacterized protein n=1 Tax=Plasmodium ovale wallikeri TaxID=864142 RepID=A0A1A8YHJ4_PLAOA|nr:hypothetical protein POVWA1_005000 [Plasmodium ovale wallikeri]